MVPVLETPRLLLRGHRLDDFTACAAMWADPVVIRHIGGVPSTEEQSWSRLLRYVGHWHHLGFGYWAVTLKEDGRYLGEVGLADYHRDTSPKLTGKPEAGWALVPQAHGKGYATEAVSAALQWADAHIDCAATSTIIAPENAGSIHVAKKVGFSNAVIGRYGEHESLFMERLRRT
ncbi:GNAT family N-acetyltransferase [Paracoccus aestuariivivens]|uniref:GNAT family N-acetyltransferase n=1 Tax=Paracoccus aestuariivivens TaxID=1820333 RepID=A0A6L6J2P7_9RHOB|nr:GNAT family N-acetyltransferase [Paracoccus aestuariivivens]MTH76352.1 GNAT family N-acetyltransferase [Paracoccus aestuariivivens]